MSRVIQNKDAAGARPWQLSEFESPVTPVASNEKPPKSHQSEPLQSKPPQLELPTTEQIAEIQAQAYQQGFEQGRREGLESAEAEMRACIERFETLMAGLATPFDQLDTQVEQELLALVSALTHQLVRRQFKLDPGELIPVIRQALAALPVAARDVRVHLNPEDSAVVRQALSLTEDERSWKIVDDPVVSRGDCRIVSDASRIDASLEARLNALMVTLLGGQRSADNKPS